MIGFKKDWILKKHFNTVEQLESNQKLLETRILMTKQEIKKIQLQTTRYKIKAKIII